MKRDLMRATVMAALLVTVAGTGFHAQEPSGSADEGLGAPAELRAAMRDYFEKRLRSDLALSDAQMDHILPRALELEEVGRTTRRERIETTRLLRRGLEQGATDGELQAQLERLERLEDHRRRRDRKLMREIDEVLSTRQRVQLRLFMQRFRGEMIDKVRELREERLRGRQGPVRRPRRGRP